MARKFGIRNEVKIDPLKYNIALLGESKIGKTTLIKNVVEKLVGTNGYIFLEMFQEEGADAIQGIVYENVPDWDAFEEITEDILDNRTTDYKDLKVIIIDTYDQFIQIAEEEAIRLWNRHKPDKQAKSINEAWDGFQKGQDKAIKLMFDRLYELKQIGIPFIMIGHVKNKNIDDVVTGGSYMQLTSDLSAKYFNALKNRLHFLGLACIDRELTKVKTGKKNVVTKKEAEITRVVGETRIIKFRDDNFAVDSGSRFADIEAEIPMTTDAFIKALEDAIKAEHAKGGGNSIEDTAKQQAADEEARINAVAAEHTKTKDAESLVCAIDNIVTYVKANASKEHPEKAVELLSKAKELGFNKLTEIDNLKAAEVILEMIEKQKAASS